ncbi:MAG: cell division protein ZapA [Burkholderiaceae bacterium]
MKQVEVTILGQSYLLACPDGGEHLLHAAVAAVDREMSAIRDAGKVKARERIAVLAALNLAYRLAELPRGAAAEPAAEAPPAPAAHPSHAEASEARRAAAAQVEMLIARLDTALNEDGRLL